MSSQAMSESRADPATDAGLDGAGLVASHRAMLLAQVLDERLGEAAREGAIEPWRSGDADAVLVGAASVLSERDWLFAGPRDLAAALRRGISLDLALAHVFAIASDPSKARALPQRLSLRSAPPVASASTHNGAHLTHAAGVAWAAKIRHDDAIALAFFDADELASPEFHNAMNFAGVFRLPVVFVAARAATLSAGESAGARGVAYGIAAVACDGDDVLAVARAVGNAAARARRGEGATIVEASASASAAAGTALSRFERALTKRGVEATALATREAITAEVDEAIARTRASVRNGPSLPAETLFDDVYAALPWHLAEERDAMRRAGR